MTQLHPSFSLYRETMESGMQMIRHPLVFAVPFFDCPQEVERLNKMLAYKIEAVDKAEAAQDWHSYVFLHERPHRLEALHRVFPDIKKATDRHRLLRMVFVDTENLVDNLPEWRELLAVGHGKDIWRTKRKLADTVQVYRGGFPHKGVSWTLDLDKAKWFANRWRRNLPVYSGVADKSNIIGYLKERGEEEIVVFHEHVRDKKVIK